MEFVGVDFFFFFNFYTKDKKNVNISDEILATSIYRYNMKVGGGIVYIRLMRFLLYNWLEGKKNSFLLVENRWPSSEFTIQFT